MADWTPPTGHPGIPWHRTANGLPYEARYRPLSPVARAFLHDLRCLAGLGDASGRVEGPVVGAAHGSRHGSIADRLGYRAHEARKAVAELKLQGWIRLLPRGSDRDPPGIRQGSAGDPDARSADVLLAGYADENPTSLFSKFRMRKHRQIKGMQGDVWGEDEAPVTSRVTSREPPGDVTRDVPGQDRRDISPPTPPPGGPASEPKQPEQPNSRRRRRDDGAARRALGRAAPDCAECGHERANHVDLGAEITAANVGKGPCQAEGCRCTTYVRDDWSDP